MHFTGITILQVSNGKIVSEVGLDDGATALQQLRLLLNPETVEAYRVEEEYLCY